MPVPIRITSIINKILDNFFILMVFSFLIWVQRYEKVRKKPNMYLIFSTKNLIFAAEILTSFKKYDTEDEKNPICSKSRHRIADDSRHARLGTILFMGYPYHGLGEKYWYFPDNGSVAFGQCDLRYIITFWELNDIIVLSIERTEMDDGEGGDLFATSEPNESNLKEFRRMQKNAKNGSFHGFKRASTE